MFERVQERQVGNRRYWGRIAAGASIALTIFVLILRSYLKEPEARRSSVSYASADDKVLATDYERVILPGMSLEVPGTGIESGDYKHGDYRAVLRPLYAVRWGLGGLDPDVETKLQAKLQELQRQQGLASPFQIVKRQVKLGGMDAIQLAVHSPQSATVKQEMVATYGTCGGRAVAITIEATDAAAIADRMIESFRCKPDPEAEAFRDDVVVAARPGWSRLDDDRLILINDANIQLKTVLFDYAEGSVADVLKRELGAIGARMTLHAKTRGDKVFWTGVDEKGVPFAVLGWRCATRVAAVLVIAPEGVALDDGISLAETGRCLAPDEKMPDYPIRRD